MDAATRYVACAKALRELQQDTQDDQNFTQALKARVQDCELKANLCRKGTSEFDLKVMQ